MSLGLSYVVFFGFLAFLFLYWSTRVNPPFKTHFVILALITLYYSSGYMASIAYYSGMSDLSNLIINTSQIMGIFLIVLFMFAILELTMYGLEFFQKKSSAI